VSIGVWQLLIVLAIVVLIFGVGKLPKAAADVAQGIKAFKRNMKDQDADEPVAPAHPAPKDPELIAADKVAADRDRGPV
jgi:sec-independent protein translocase protein TatA